MTKAEMQEHQTEFDALAEKARTALQAKRFDQALQAAVASLKHIDGMMQFEKKYEFRTFASVETIDLILNYAPLVFDTDCLDQLGYLFKSQKRVDRDATDDLGQRLAQARASVWAAYRLWDHIERNPSCRQDELRRYLSGDQDDWRRIAERWDSMELLSRSAEGGSYRLKLRGLDQSVIGKCTMCGATTEMAKTTCLADGKCTLCGEQVTFVMVSELC